MAPAPNRRCTTKRSVPANSPAVWSRRPDATARYLISFVVRLAADDRERAIKLLEQNQPRQPMRERHLAERERELGGFADRVVGPLPPPARKRRPVPSP